MAEAFFGLFGPSASRSQIRRVVAVFSLILAVCTPVAPAAAALLLSDNFDSATPGGSYDSNIMGSAFSVFAGNVDVIGQITNGAANGYFSCPAGGPVENNCLDLNGTLPGAVKSTARFNLIAGRSYMLNFSAAGSMVDTARDPYRFTVALGNSGATGYTVAAGSSFAAQRFTYTPTINEDDAALVLASTTDIAGARQYGALIDNLRLTDNAPVFGQSRAPGGGTVESFNSAQPGSNISSLIAGTGFAVVAGNVDVMGTIVNGAAAGFFTCPVGLPTENNCIDLNGNQPGAIATAAPMLLLAGTTYEVSFALAGNIDDGTHAAYAMHAQLGNSGAISFSTLPGSSFTTETFTYTPITDEVAAFLQFTSDSTAGNPIFGAFIDNISVVALSNGAAVAVPEPGSMMMVLIGLSGLGGIRHGATRRRQS
ncbi:MAG: hypothetical protein H7251_16200 [Acetobacteraceae bacterium]|nr:hypothetical protein [Acetobacteraceae bacterium]